MVTSSKLVYDEIAPYYASYIHTRKAYMAAVDAKIISRINHGGTSIDILDVGSGDGLRSKEIISSLNVTPRLTQLDESEEMFRHGKTGRGAPVTQVVGDICRPPDSLATYDIVMALFNVFGHILPESRRLQALRSIHKLLRPDSVFIFDISNRYNAAEYGWGTVLRNVATDSFDRGPNRGNHTYRLSVADGVAPLCTCHFFRPREADRLLRQAGFEIVEKQYLNYRTGQRESLPWRGQLLYVARPVTTS